jgi:hypothetical protein
MVRYFVNQRDLVSKSQMCGCYYCCTIFPASEVYEYICEQFDLHDVDDDQDVDNDWGYDIDCGHRQTAMCPKCNIDSLIMDAEENITESKLRQLHCEWF